MGKKKQKKKTKSSSLAKDIEVEWEDDVQSYYQKVPVQAEYVIHRRPIRISFRSHEPFKCDE